MRAAAIGKDTSTNKSSNESKKLKTTNKTIKAMHAAKAS